MVLASSGIYVKHSLMMPMMKLSLMFLLVPKETVMTGMVGDLDLNIWFVLIISFFCVN